MYTRSAITNRISCLIMVALLFIVFTISAQAGKPPKDEPESGNGIGPEGGVIDAGYNSYLLIPEGALTETIEITAGSCDSSIAEDSAAVVATLHEQISLLDSISVYLQQLPDTDDGCGEWIKSQDARKIVSWLSNGISQINRVLEAHNAGDGWGALEELHVAFRFLSDFEASLNQTLQDNDIGYQAHLNVQADIDQSFLLLQTVDDLYHSTLTFEFGPHGTEFLIPAELVIPFKEISIADESFWYSTGEAELVDVIQMDYFIDEVNETYHFIIDHFSYYYYERR